jgi:hypothetical protein
MAYNDFSSVQAVLSDQFVLERPQSNERVRGAEKYVQMNAEYPHGLWNFTLNRAVATTTVVRQYRMWAFPEVAKRCACSQRITRRSVLGVYLSSSEHYWHFELQ